MENASRFEGGGQDYHGKYLGCVTVQQNKGQEVCQEAMQKLLTQLKGRKEPKQRLVINLSFEGTRLKEMPPGTDLMDVLFKHTEVSYVWKDPRDQRSLGIIRTEPDPEDNSKVIYNFHGIRTIKPALPFLQEMQSLFQIVKEQSAERKLQQKEQIEDQPNSSQLNSDESKDDASKAAAASSSSSAAAAAAAAAEGESGEKDRTMSNLLKVDQELVKSDSRASLDELSDIFSDAAPAINSQGSQLQSSINDLFQQQGLVQNQSAQSPFAQSQASNPFGQNLGASNAFGQNQFGQGQSVQSTFSQNQGTQDPFGQNQIAQSNFSQNQFAQNSGMQNPFAQNQFGPNQAAGQNQAVHNPFGQNQLRQTPLGQNQFGQAQFGQNQFGQAPIGQNQFGQAPIGQNQFGQVHVGQNQFGQAHVGQNQFGQAPVGQNQFGQAHVGQNQFGQAHVGQNQFGQAQFGQSNAAQNPFGQAQVYSAQVNNGQAQFGQMRPTMETMNANEVNTNPFGNDVVSSVFDRQNSLPAAEILEPRAAVATKARTPDPSIKADAFSDLVLGFGGIGGTAKGPAGGKDMLKQEKPKVTLRELANQSSRPQ